MALTIASLSTRTSSTTPVELLLECHDRIRQAMLGARALAAASAEDPAVAPTAGAVRHYFAVALPLHSEDEELSLAPRLFTVGVPDDVAGAVRMMEAQHLAIDAVLDRLLPLWERLERAPADLDALRPALAADTSRLDELWDLHLELEEQVIFPRAAADLPERERDAIVAEMRARRQPQRR